MVGLLLFLLFMHMYACGHLWWHWCKRWLEETRLCSLVLQKIFPSEIFLAVNIWASTW